MGGANSRAGLAAAGRSSTSSTVASGLLNAESRSALGRPVAAGERQWGRLRRAPGIREGDVAEIGRVAPVALVLLTLAAC